MLDYMPRDLLKIVWLYYLDGYLLYVPHCYFVRRSLWSNQIGLVLAWERCWPEGLPEAEILDGIVQEKRAHLGTHSRKTIDFIQSHLPYARLKRE